MSLVADTAQRARVPMPIGSLLKDRYTSAAARGWGELDWSAIGLAVSADAGVDVAPHVARCTPPPRKE